MARIMGWPARTVPPPGGRPYGIDRLAHYDSLDLIFEHADLEKAEAAVGALASGNDPRSVRRPRHRTAEKAPGT